MGKSKSVFKDSILYTIGNLMLKAFSFFLLPLYTSFLTPEEYGFINLASGFYMVASVLISLCLGSALVRFYADFKEDKQKVAIMLGTAFTTIGIVGIIFCVLSFIFKDVVSTLFFNGLPFFPISFLSICISVVTALYSVYQECLKGMRQAKKSVLFSYIYFFLLLFGNIFTVCFLKMGGAGVLWSTLIVLLFMTVFMFVDLSIQKLFVITVDKNLLKMLMRYSIPLIPHSLAFNITNYVTKIIIAKDVSLTMLGIYSLASQFGNIADVVLNSVQAAFQPWIFERLKNKESIIGNSLSKVIYSLMWIYGFVFLGIALFSHELILLIADESYVNAVLYVPIVVMAVAIKAPMYFYNSFLYFDINKTKYVFISTLVYSIINIILTALLVPRFFIYGSIIADIIAMLVRMLVIFFVLPKELSMLLSIRKLTLLSMISILFIVIAMLPTYIYNVTHFSLCNFGYKVLMLIIYVILIVCMNKERVMNLLRGKKVR